MWKCRGWMKKGTQIEICAASVINPVLGRRGGHLVRYVTEVLLLVFFLNFLSGSEAFAHFGDEGLFFVRREQGGIGGVHAE